MKLTEVSVRYPVSVSVVVLLCVLFGVIAIDRIPKQMMPTLDRPEITVETPYPGAGPFEVEEEITNRQEELLNTVENLREMTSESSEGMSSITLSYDWGVDKAVARLDASEKLAAVRGLPDDAEESIVRAVNSDESQPIAWIVLVAKAEINTVRPLADDVIRAQFERVPGVGQVRFFGGEEAEVWVDVDMGALATLGLTIDDVRRALVQENRNVKAGTFDEGKRRFGVRTVGRFRSPEDVAETIVRRTTLAVVRVKDVATVRPGFEERDSVVRQSGEPALMFGIIRKTGSNTLEVMEQVRTVIDAMNARYAAQGITLRLVYDATDYIEQAIDLVTQNLLVGAILATGVLLFFLGSGRAVLVLGLSIPISLVTTFVLIWGFGRSLNIISLAGLTFASGMVLDNAIVVVENIFRHRELGKGSARAAIDGTVEVWGAILASTLTTLAVFVPIILIEDEAGQIFRDIAIAISIAVALSLVVAVTVIPCLASNLLSQNRPGAQGRGRGDFGAEVTRFVERAIGDPKVRAIALAAIALLAVVPWLAAPPLDYLPQGNRNLVLLSVRTPPGSNLVQNERIVRLIEERVLPLPEVERSFAITRASGPFMGVVVKEEFADKSGMQAFADRVRELVKDVPGAQVSVNQPSIIRAGGIGRAGLQIDIRGDSLDRIQQIAGALETKLVRLDEVQSVRPSFELGQPEYVVDVDRVRAAELGLTVQDVGLVVETAVRGISVGTIDQQGDEVDLSVRAPEGSVASARDLSRTTLYTPTGRTIQLGDIARVEARKGPTAIEHIDMDRSVKLFVQSPSEIPLQQIRELLEANIAPMRADLPLGYTITVAGRAQDLDRMLDAFMPAMGLALLITFLLLASLFESFLIPVVIFVCVPFAASGGMAALRLLRGIDPTVQLDTITLLGFVILLGVVVNNAILIVHQALNRLAEGLDVTEAVLDSVRNRVRPILMTMITTVFGMSPLVFASGSGSELYRGLGAILVGGLLLSTVVTIVLVPIVLSFTLATIGARMRTPQESGVSA